jgi:uncharacterized membrane protein YuzA (DUF378 family)
LENLSDAARLVVYILIAIGGLIGIIIVFQIFKNLFFKKKRKMSMNGDH